MLGLPTLRGPSERETGRVREPCDRRCNASAGQNAEKAAIPAARHSGCCVGHIVVSRQSFTLRLCMSSVACDSMTVNVC